MILIIILFYIMQIVISFPSNLFNESDLELFRPIKPNKEFQFSIRWNEQHKLIWIENENTKNQFIFCMKNSTLTLSIPSPIKKKKEKFGPLNNKKICLFDGLCNVDYPEYELIRFYKLQKANEKFYQFQSNYNFYLDLDTNFSDINTNFKLDERVMNKNVRLCRKEESYHQLFQSETQKPNIEIQTDQIIKPEL
eukprot:233638_1